jgi:hypothetical protein
LAKPLQFCLAASDVYPQPLGLLVETGCLDPLRVRVGPVLLRLRARSVPRCPVKLSLALVGSGRRVVPSDCSVHRLISAAEHTAALQCLSSGVSLVLGRLQPGLLASQTKLVRVGFRSLAANGGLVLVQTARANDLELYAYLRRLLAELPTAQTVEQIEALLPWGIKP